jgi:hypothetical protein
MLSAWRIRRFENLEFRESGETTLGRDFLTLLPDAAYRNYRSNCARAIFATCLRARRSDLSLAIARIP